MTYDSLLNHCECVVGMYTGKTTGKGRCDA